MFYRDIYIYFTVIRQLIGNELFSANYWNQHWPPKKSISVELE